MTCRSSSMNLYRQRKWQRGEVFILKGGCRPVQECTNDLFWEIVHPIFFVKWSRSEVVYFANKFVYCPSINLTVIFFFPGHSLISSYQCQIDGRIIYQKSNLNNTWKLQSDNTTIQSLAYLPQLHNFPHHPFTFLSFAYPSSCTLCFCTIVKNTWSSVVGLTE